jgi:hypothetical protein
MRAFGPFLRGFATVWMFGIAHFAATRADQMAKVGAVQAFWAASAFFAYAAGLALAVMLIITAVVDVMEGK